MNCSTAWGALQSLEGGIQLTSPQTADADLLAAGLTLCLQELDLHAAVQTLIVPNEKGQNTLICNLRTDLLSRWLPEHDTLALHQKLGHRFNTQCQADSPAHHHHADELGNDALCLEREIWVAMLGSPIRCSFSSLAALQSHIRVRRNIALAARKTALAFKTEASERPEQDWHYDEAHGFILQPGRPLIQALIAATQPEATGKLYDFSCYRATEYVILLGIAQELQTHNPTLLAALQKLNERHAIRSGQFHDVYLVEYGSMQAPLPARFYVPGDRLWFRNPDERSSDVTGYEGSWVIYMGGGLFSNFWQRDRPFTLESKAIEIFHWRDGVYTDASGNLQMDECVVEQHVAHTATDPLQYRQVLDRMVRMRDPKGVYADGGCIDTTREYPRGVSPHACELVLPAF